MSRGISGGKQVIKIADTSNHGRVCLLSQNESTIFLVQNVQFEFSQVYIIIDCCENIYCRYCIQNSLPLSSIEERVLYFMTSVINKLDRDFLYRRI